MQINNIKIGYFTSTHASCDFHIQAKHNLKSNIISSKVNTCGYIRLDGTGTGAQSIEKKLERERANTSTGCCP
jgi:hypothetical protein